MLTPSGISLLIILVGLRIARKKGSSGISRIFFAPVAKLFKEALWTVAEWLNLLMGVVESR
jgi:hypothetical protein